MPEDISFWQHPASRWEQPFVATLIEPVLSAAQDPSQGGGGGGGGQGVN